MTTVAPRRFAGWFALVGCTALVWLAPSWHDGATGLLRLLQILATGPGNDIEAVLFWDGTLPRLSVGLMTGAALGLSGALMQQLTGNLLASPMTLGTSSGAWLAMTCGAVWAPALLASHPDWLALGGAAGATLLLGLLTGLRRLASLQLVLAGMALNILLGALASAIALLNDRYAVGIFVWGAGDLAQYDWHWASWLAPRLILPLFVLPLVARPLALLRLGQEAAAGRGLALAPTLAAVLLLSLWLTACAVAAVGLIGFVSVLAPILARRGGARSLLAQWLASALLGALLLVLADGLAVGVGHWLADSVPSGAAAALIGAPALVWLLWRARGLPDAPVEAVVVPSLARAMLLWSAFAALSLLSITVARAPDGWHLVWPDAAIAWLRWPRLLAATAAGAGLAVAGVILQRLLRNPLASPDMLGVSAGATLALIVWSAVSGVAVQQGGWLPALAGSGLALAVLIAIGRRLAWSPVALALVGLSLSALLDGIVQFILARGSLDVIAVLAWLAGSTYRVGSGAALALAIGVAACLAVAFAARRALSLLSLGDNVAVGRGLRVARARAGFLLLSALLSGLVTSLLGPVAFVGILAPHLATRLGARGAGAQLIGAAVVGICLMLLADMLGRTVLWPAQLPVGLCAALLSGGLLASALALKRSVP